MKKSKNYKDLYTGLGVIIIALFYLVFSFKIKVFAGSGATVLSSRTIPIFWGICFFALGIMLVLRCFLKRDDQVSEEVKGYEKGEEVAFIHKYAVPLTLALLVLYVFLFKTFGFVLDSIIYLFCEMFILSPQKTKKLWLIIVLSVFIPVVVYFLFVYALNVPLPAGFLKF